MSREIPSGLMFDVADHRPSGGSSGPLEPLLSPLFGCQIWTNETLPARGEGGPEPMPKYRSHVAASESTPPPYEPCGVCGAVRDDSGNVLVLDLIGLDGEPVRVRTGIREGDRYVCGCCGCTPPGLADRIRRGRPRPSKPVRRPPARPKLTRRDRQEFRSSPDGRAYLAMLDAEDAGDRERASEIRLAFRLRAEGLLSAEELDERFELVEA